MLLAGLTHWPASFALVHKASLAGLGFTLSLLLRLAYRAMRWRGLPLPWMAAAALPISWAAAGTWMALHNAIVSAYLARQRGTPLLAGFPDFTNTIYYFFTLVAWSVLYFGVHAYLDLHQERERVLKAQALAHQARLAALRLQLNPHFLFNTLNAISTLVAEGRGADANRMIARLADFLRTTLARANADEIPLAEEVDWARRYLDIEMVRFGPRLAVSIEVEEAASPALVPTLILQPLVENAVRHAISPARGGAVEIRAARSEGFVTLGVHDDGGGAAAPDLARGHGIGLANTRARLEELYGAQSELRYGRSPRGGLAVSIRIPFKAAQATP
jgi:LytS/YehU family sensor histidine kinase